MAELVSVPLHFVDRGTIRLLMGTMVQPRHIPGEWGQVATIAVWHNSNPVQ